MVNSGYNCQTTHYQSWRLIPYLKASGQTQMAIDSWLLEQYCQGLSGPVLRFYQWLPAAISLGYHQHQWPVCWENLTWQGEKIDLIRRPTGGRAVLHQGDLTYAVITSSNGKNRLASYQWICQFLIAGLEKLGVNLSYGNVRDNSRTNPNCFATATSADLVLPDGTKLIGSAQLRKDGAVLQHGSIRLNPDLKLFEQVFGAGERFNSPLITEQEVMAVLITAAQECFQVEIIEKELTDREWSEIGIKMLQ